jgi:hypothetical protein
MSAAQRRAQRAYLKRALDLLEAVTTTRNKTRTSGGSQPTDWEGETVADTLHPQTTIRHEWREAEVDVEIAPLILALWRLGLDTVNSCQNNHGRVWIEFGSVEDGECFLDTILSYDTDMFGLYNRAKPRWRPISSSPMTHRASLRFGDTPYVSGTVIVEVVGSSRQRPVLTLPPWPAHTPP